MFYAKKLQKVAKHFSRIERCLNIDSGYMYRVGQKSKPQTFVHIFTKILIDSYNSFTDTLSRKFEIKILSQTSSHLKCVTTLPCKIGRPSVRMLKRM